MYKVARGLDLPKEYFKNQDASFISRGPTLSKISYALAEINFEEITF